jgi:uncharacterized protein (DUF924 family)
MPPPSPAEIIEFWFSERARPLWFEKNATFDEEVRARFGAAVATACAGQLDGWTAAPESCLALAVLLDQFPRNIHRGTPRAFAADAKARAAAGIAIDRGFDQRTPLDRRCFFYLPFEHSEDRADQHRSVALFRRWAEAHHGRARDRALDQLAYVLRHQEIIERFGRFPHRNAILGRESTPEEIAFLQEPKSSF